MPTSQNKQYPIGTDWLTWIEASSKVEIQTWQDKHFPNSNRCGPRLCPINRWAQNCQEWKRSQTTPKASMGHENWINQKSSSWRVHFLGSTHRPTWWWKHGQEIINSQRIPLAVKVNKKIQLTKFSACSPKKVRCSGAEGAFLQHCTVAISENYIEHKVEAKRTKK